MALRTTCSFWMCVVMLGREAAGLRARSVCRVWRAQGPAGARAGPRPATRGGAAGRAGRACRAPRLSRRDPLSRADPDGAGAARRRGRREAHRDDRDRHPRPLDPNRAGEGVHEAVGRDRPARLGVRRQRQAEHEARGRPRGPAGRSGPDLSRQIPPDQPPEPRHHNPPQAPRRRSPTRRPTRRSRSRARSRHRARSRRRRTRTRTSSSSSRTSRSSAP